MSQQWKSAEREVAEFFGGTRRVRVSYSEMAGDIIHPEYSIEVKYGRQVPKYLRVTDATLLVCKHVTVLIAPSQRWVDGATHIKHIVNRESCQFLENAFDQAQRYDPMKKPIVAVKSKGMRGFIVCQLMLAP